MRAELRILHLEDDSEDAALIATRLQREGISCEIILVDTREKFMASLDQGGFDIILANYALGPFDGLFALASAREKSPGTPFILISGAVGEDTAVEVLKRGATDYVLKDRLFRLVPCIQRALREVSDRRARAQVEAALRESQWQLAGIIGAATDAIISVDHEERILLFNTAAEKMFGCTVLAAIGKPLEQFIPERYRKAYAEYIDRFGHSRAPGRWHSRLGRITGLRANGQDFPIEASISKVEIAGKTIETLILRDITARKRSQEKSKRYLERTSALREIDLAITASLDLQTVLDVLLEKVQLFLPIVAASTVRLVNPVPGELNPLACRGIDRAKWLARQRRPIDRRVKQVVETRQLLWERDLSQHALSVDGEFFRQEGIASYLGVPLVAKDRVIGVLGLYTRTEHGFDKEEIDFVNALAARAAIAIHNAQLFERINSQTRELEKSNKVMEEFLNVMSHELRTPLNITMGYVGMMVDGMLGELSQEQKIALEKVLNQSSDQLRMIEDILLTTHLESHTLIIERENVDLVEVFRLLKSDFEAIYHHNEPQLLWNYPAEALPAITDGRKLRQIVQNLVNNALKFTERGRVTVTVEAVAGGASRLPRSIEKSGIQQGDVQWLEIKVTDTGIGIPPDRLDAIFDKFYQLDSSATRHYGGLGLGLYIAKQFTELLGGKIRVETEPGRGSTFTVTIPART